MSFAVRKSTPCKCPFCGKMFKNIFAVSGHKGFCSGSQNNHHLKGKRGGTKGKILIPDTEVFCENSQRATGYVKHVILTKKLLPYRCSVCGVEDWRGSPLVLELDHINGIRNDHRFHNLRLLCPNCHSQTDTWRGRQNKGKRRRVDDTTLLTALQESRSIRSALLKVGLAPMGGNYARCHSLLGMSK